MLGIGYNPFIEISVLWRRALLLLFFYFYFLDPLVFNLVVDSYPYSEVRLSLKLLINFLLVAPLIFYVKGEFGWLHPLIFPNLVSFLKSVVKNKFSMLSYFQDFNYDFFHPLFKAFTSYEMSEVYIKADILRIIGILSMYTGFFLIKKRNNIKIRFKVERTISFRLVIIALIGVSFGLFLIQSQGGIESQILAMGRGRFRMRQDLGGSHFIVFSNLLMVSTYAWFLLKKNAFKNPIFILLVFVSLSLSFILTGSRGGIVNQVIVLGFIYVFHFKRVPIIQGAVAGFVIFIIVGALGIIRDSGLRNNEVQWNAITNTSLEEKINLTVEEIDNRSSGYVAVIGKGHEKVGMLWGRTYLSAILFWIPRAIWPEKPRGAGAYNGNMIYGEKKLEDYPYGGDGNGVPTGGVGEAYWNFGLLGVVFVYFLFGILSRWISELFKTNYQNKFVVLLYILSLTILTAYSRTIVSFFQIAVLSTIVFWFIGYFNPFKIGSYRKV